MQANGKLVVDFSTSERESYLDSTINFYDESDMGATAWLWDFGDGNTSTEQNPVHSYPNAGFYTVSLTATNEKYDISLSKTKTNYIVIAPNNFVYSSFTDSRDNNTYKTIEIGNQRNNFV